MVDSDDFYMSEEHAQSLIDEDQRLTQEREQDQDQEPPDDFVVCESKSQPQSSQSRKQKARSASVALDAPPVSKKTREVEEETKEKAAYEWHNDNGSDDEEEEGEQEEEDVMDEDDGEGTITTTEQIGDDGLPEIINFDFARVAPPRQMQEFYFTDKFIKRETADLIKSFEMPPGDGQALLGRVSSQLSVLRLDVDALARQIRRLYNLCGGDSHPTNIMDVQILCNRIFPPSFEQSETGILFNTKTLYFYTGSLIESLNAYDRERNTDLKRYDVPQLRLHLERCQERLHALEMFRVATCRVRSTFDPKFDGLMVHNDGLTSEPFVDESEYDDYQVAMIHVLRRAHLYRARRYYDSIYFPHMHNGVFTHSFVCKFTVQEFVEHLQSNMQEFKFLVKRGLAKNLKEQLSAWHSYHLPLLVQDRHTFSFRNGIYNAAENRFFTYDDAPRNLIAVNFKDADFNDYPEFDGPYYPGGSAASTDDDLVEAEDDWMHIPTPNFDRIFDYQWPQSKEEQQRLPPNERTIDPRLLKRMFYAFLGRLFCDVKEFDQWQKIPIVLGRGGTGKSILVTLFHSHIYKGKLDCATLGAENQKTFGLETIYNKLLYIITEMRRTRDGGFGLPETDFLSMVAGDPIGIRRKNKEMLETTWTVPGLVVGNEFCGYHEVGGSLGRRLFLVNFDRPVHKKDKVEKLERNIISEVPAIILKCARAYYRLREHMDVHNIDNIDQLIPRQVERNVSVLMSSADEVLSFFRSTDNKLLIEPEQGEERRQHPRLWIPWSELYRTFLDWKKAHGLKTKDDRVYQPHEWIEPLRIFGCYLFPAEQDGPKMKTASMHYPRNSQNTQTAVWVMNVDSIFRCSDEERVLFDCGVGAVIEQQLEDQQQEMNGLAANDADAAANVARRPRATYHRRQARQHEPTVHFIRQQSQQLQPQQQADVVEVDEQQQNVVVSVSVAPEANEAEREAASDSVPESAALLRDCYEKVNREMCMLGKGDANVPETMRNKICALSRRLTAFIIKTQALNPRAADLPDALDLQRTLRLQFAKFIHNK